jgi:hypothetical protein
MLKKEAENSSAATEIARKQGAKSKTARRDG